MCITLKEKERIKLILVLVLEAKKEKEKFLTENKNQSAFWTNWLKNVKYYSTMIDSDFVCSSLTSSGAYPSI